MQRLIGTLSLIFIAFSATAQMPPPSGVTQTGSPITSPSLQKLVTIDAEDAFLPSILAILASESGYNIVTGPGVNKEERVTVHLKNTPIEQAMNLVVRAAGLSYELVGNSFLVAPAKQLKEEVGQTSYVVELQYSSASEVAKMLDDFNAKVQVDTAGNKLLIITSAKVISEIERVIKAVDRPSLQIMLEALLIEVAVEDEEKLGIDWGKLSEISTTAIEMGNDQFRAPTMVPPPTRYKELPDEISFYPVDGFLDAGSMARQPTLFQITLDFLMKNNKAEVLANSKIATMNNRVAVIKLVDVIPYILSSGGLGGQVQVLEKEVGIMLQIKPTVNTDGYITTEITPEVSSVFQLVGPQNNIPWIIKRTSTTTLRIKDGQSIVIAGLLGVTAKITKHKLPFLGDIPLIGGLFRHEAENIKKTDLIIQVTPRIISGPESGIETPEIIEKAKTKFLSDASGASGQDSPKTESQPAEPGK